MAKNDYERKDARKYDALARGKMYAPDDVEGDEHHCHESAQSAVFGETVLQLTQSIDKYVQYAIGLHACEAQLRIRRKQH